ncbi:MAG: hypothetical protein Q8N35_12385 [Methylococcaceae bacterium]|jgi:carbonic anhydrase|nr:hypothetical protein [Methylococcaceae bacterium]MDZ4158056.1 hypothetical protein [Methylococcales bacterium]MDP2392847.1 hypothetical protein [Methylococcaceae bacterium]MDP3020375.1 hypothetical protein [Methylococcaceae bacterium]MDP3391982.1 hypothetical protein [Methylococcaceae bacterium]
MQKLIQGLQHYQTKIFGSQQELFERLSQGNLKLHDWIYTIETGEVFGYDPESCQFLILTEQRPLTAVPERNLVGLEI